MESSKAAQELLPLTAGERPVKPQAIRRQRWLWLAIVLLLLLFGAAHMMQSRELQRLQQQLVATQDSFAGLGEESIQHLHQLDERTAGLNSLQGRVQGMSVRLNAVQQQLQQQEGIPVRLQALQEVQAALEQKVPEFSQRLLEQSQAVEQVALALDGAQQQLQATLERQAQEGEARMGELSVQTGLLADAVQELRSQWQQQQEQLGVLQEQAGADRERLESLLQMDERFAGLQQSVLTLAQRLDVESKQQQELAKEMSAFRLQVTRAQDRLQQRLDQMAQ